MSFWATSTGEDVAAAPPTEYSTGGGNFDNIPDDSDVLASISAAKWDDDKDANSFISLEWVIAKPEEFANRKVWQKLWVKDPDPRAKKPEQKRDKALRMLATIDANAGGRLAKRGTQPTDDELALALTGKPMVIKVMVWEMGEATGNWVAAVSPADKPVKIGKITAPVERPIGKWSSADELDDDIPF